MQTHTDTNVQKQSISRVYIYTMQYLDFLWASRLSFVQKPDPHLSRDSSFWWVPRGSMNCANVVNSPVWDTWWSSTLLGCLMTCGYFNTDMVNTVTMETMQNLNLNANITEKHMLFDLEAKKYSFFEKRSLLLDIRVLWTLIHERQLQRLFSFVRHLSVCPKLSQQIEPIEMRTWSTQYIEFGWATWWSSDEAGAHGQYSQHAGNATENMLCVCVWTY